MGYSGQRTCAQTWHAPRPGALRARSALTKQVVAAPGGTPHRVLGGGVAIDPQETEYRARTAACDIEQRVGGDEVIGDEFCCPTGVFEEASIAETRGHHR